MLQNMHIFKEKAINFQNFLENVINDLNYSLCFQNNCASLN